MTDPAFLDTNILCYTKDSTDSKKHKKALQLVEDLMTSGRIRVSTQVISEFYVFLKRVSRSSSEKIAARLSAEALHHFQPVSIDVEIQVRAWFLEDRFQISWWDALIVAAAEKSGSQVLYSEDLQHGQRIGNIRVMNPFLEENS